MANSEKRDISRIQFQFYSIALIIILVWALIITRNFVVPLAWGFFFAVSMLPLVDWMEGKRMNRALAIIISVLIFTIAILGILFALSAQVVAISSDMPTISTKFAAFIEQAKVFLVEDLGLASNTDELNKIKGDQIDTLMGWAFGNISSIGQSFFDFFLLPIYIYFILMYRDIPGKFIEERYSASNRDRIVKVFRQVQKVVRGYIVGISLFTAITAAMNVLVFLVLGVDYALFFAILVAILGLVPYVGNLVAMVIVGGYTLITSDTLLTPALVLVLLTVANAIQENVIRPWIVGSSTDINAFAVFLSFIIGALIWGVSGMILFIPLIGVVKIILEEVPSLKPYAVFLKEWKSKKQVAVEEPEQTEG